MVYHITNLVANRMCVFRMSSLAVVFLAFALTGAAEMWQQKQLSSDWTFKTVRKRIDPSNMLVSTNASTLIGCVSFCSNLDGAIMQSLFFISTDGKCACNPEIDEYSEDERYPEIVHGTRKSLSQVETKVDSPLTRTTVWPYKQDCSDLFEDMYHDDGVFVIHPPGGHVTDTWCDMANGGWTVIQRRQDGSEDFNRSLTDYITGFGKRTGEYWLGLENMHLLTSNGSELVIYMSAYPGTTPPSMKAVYANFTIGNSGTKYRVITSGFSGTCGDSFSASGHPFTTFDDDNDLKSFNCAVRNKGGWWYGHCSKANLNGLYYKEGEYLFTQHKRTGIHWASCWELRQSSRFAVMKIRRHQ